MLEASEDKLGLCLRDKRYYMKLFTVYLLVSKSIYRVTPTYLENFDINVYLSDGV